MSTPPSLFNTSDVFQPGYLTTVLDGGTGSGGKGKLGSFLTEHADNWQFACNTYSPQAGHWVRLDDGREFFYRSFNSCAYQEHYERLLFGPGAIINLELFFQELEASNIPADRIALHPLVGVLQDIDSAYERGQVDLQGRVVPSAGTMEHGSTCRGAGAARARRILRHPTTLLAREVPELREFICDTSTEIAERLDRGQAGLLEVAQGFALSYGLSRFYPHCTSRNCTVAAGLDDLMLAPRYAGPVVLNLRTFPMRIANEKYIAPDGTLLSADEAHAGQPHTVRMTDSGPGYPDQEEVSWEWLRENSGDPELETEVGMLAPRQRPRRVFTFSRMNLAEAIRHNDTGGPMHLSINFANYVDSTMHGKRGRFEECASEKLRRWVDENVLPITTGRIQLRFVGTGPLTDDMLTV